MQKTTFKKLFVFMIVMGVLLPSGGAFSQNQQADIENQLFLPIVMRNYPPIFLTDMWVSNSDGYKRSTFLPAEEIRYITVGDNPNEEQINVDLQWDQVGPCESTQIFTATLNLEPGLWVHSLAETAPVCLGTYTNTIQLVYKNLTQTLMTTFEVVDYSSEIVISDKPGFDKCGLPTVEQMQTWWLESPYQVFNIYLGGSSFACDNPQLNVDWIWQVSQQGWEFILTWVGPQSPCFTTTKPKISLDPDIAYQQGQDEAELAIAAAEKLGLGGDKIIYYDVEAYTDSSACRNAVDVFIQGWTLRLHEQGFKAGAYGTPCTSYVSDWWDNDPRLNDIWIARWLSGDWFYNPDVEVWGEICGLTDEQWNNHQRLRQYTGGHGETWGDVPLTIDSNILLGEITAVTTTMSISTTNPASAAPLLANALLRQAQQLTANTGWVLKGNQLLMTQDAGITWDEITPPGIGSIMDVDFSDLQNGWLVSPNNQGDWMLFQTKDQGVTWQSSKLPTSSSDVGAVYLDFVDAQTGWVVLKMVSSSSFSVGQLFATQDGGRTWEERPIPLGETVQFSDALHGWVAGGPTEKEFYRTVNGGRSWSAASEQAYLSARQRIQPALEGSLPENTVHIDHADAENAWALTQSGSCSGEKKPTSRDAAPLQCWQQTLLWATQNGGQTWQEITP